MNAPRTRTQAQGRPGDGPVRVITEVLSREREGAYWTLSLAANEIAQRAKPGQFVAIAVEGKHTLLRRPFSIARASTIGTSGGTVEVVFDVHGPGTEWLANLKPHDPVDVIGPLGNGFPMPRDRKPCLLVGGGYGIAPLLLLADTLRSMGNRVDMIVGAGSRDRLFNQIEAKRMSASITFTTDDGSFGTRGVVTDVLGDVVERTGTGTIYACGPMPMLHAVSEATADLDVPTWLATEEHMACGVGVCMTCVIPVEPEPERGRQPDPEAYRNVRSCLEGPVFDATRIRWERTRFGAPAAGDDDAAAASAPPASQAPPAPTPPERRPGELVQETPARTTVERPTPTVPPELQFPRPQSATDAPNDPSSGEGTRA